MKLLIKTENPVLTTVYNNHQHYNPGDSGLDLFCPETITINPGETVKINLQTPLRLSNSVGIIDAGYRGDIIACVDNIKNESYTITQGDRLFQICAGNLEPIEFQLVNDLSNTQRGTSGFGSTGL